MRQFLCAAGLLLAALPCRAQAPLSHPLAPSDWRADIDVLNRDMVRFIWGGLDDRGHAAFDSARADVIARLPTLADDAAVVGVAAMVAAVGDDQTAVQFPTAWRRYAIGTRWFGCTARSIGPCELWVITASPTTEQYLGMRVVAIDGVPAAEAHRRIAAIIPGELTKGATFDHSTTLFQFPNVLHGAGVANRADTAWFTLQDSTGAAVTVPVATVTPAEAARPWRRAQLREPFARLRPNDPVWWAMLPDGRNVFVALRGFPDSAAVARVVDSLIPFADQHHAERIVVDLRRNTGGDYELVTSKLIPALAAHPVYGRRGRIYVLTGWGTLGNGAALAHAFRTGTNATLVGLPTGTRPSLAVERSQVTLPNSGLVVTMTRESMVGPATGPVGVQPDHRAETTWPVFHEGRDIALEWAVAQPAPASAPTHSVRSPAHQRKSAPKRPTPS